MSWNAEALYALLPAIHRQRDAEAGHPLRQFLDVLGTEARILEEETEQLQDNAFVETAAEWVLPYIGDLIGYRTIQGLPAAIDRRAEIANTIAYRRAKGTLVMLEQLARDVTGWPAAAVEYFDRLVTNQAMIHPRPHSRATADLRLPLRLERRGSAFDRMAHTIDVGRIPIGEGRHNIRNIGLFLWRLQAVPERRVTAGAHPTDPRRFYASPLATNAPMFNPPLAEPGLRALVGPLHVPEPISRLALDAGIEQYVPRAMSIVADGVELRPVDVRACNLADDGADWAHHPPGVVAVDPELGRIRFPPDRPPPASMLVSWHRGFPDRIAGGSYERAAGFAPGLAPVLAVSDGVGLQAAIDLAASGGTVEIADSLTYADGAGIAPAGDIRIELRSANGQRAHVRLSGDLVLDGAADSEISLDGLLISGGRIHVPAGSALRRLTIRHCTLVPGLTLAPDGAPVSPGSPSILVESQNLILEIADSITGPILAPSSASLHVRDSIIDATDRTRVAVAGPDSAGPGPVCHLLGCTIIGKLHAAAFMLVSNSLLLSGLADDDLWTAPVRAERRQIGCVRFSFVPDGSVVPRRHRCQPSDAIAAAIRAARAQDPALGPVAEQAIAAGTIARMVPAFTSTRFADPAYMQLLAAVPADIRTGADTGAEMGVWHRLFQPQRTANLAIRLDEYLPFGLEAGQLHAS